MNPELKKTMLDVCNKEIETKGAAMGISFYAFFKNKNDDPALLMEAATWWIQTHKLDHFEKATKIRQLLNAWA